MGYYSYVLWGLEVGKIGREAGGGRFVGGVAHGGGASELGA